jgi:hypothetical protein
MVTAEARDDAGNAAPWKAIALNFGELSLWDRMRLAVCVLRGARRVFSMQRTS